MFQFIPLPAWVTSNRISKWPNVFLYVFNPKKLHPAVHLLIKILKKNVLDSVWKCCFIVALFCLSDWVFFTGPGRIWPRSGTKKQSLRGRRGLVMPDRPAGQHRWTTKALKKFIFSLDWLCPLTDAELCQCSAGCDADRPERGSQDHRPASSRQADRRGRHSGWKVLSEERRGRRLECQHERVHGNNRDQSRMEHNGRGEWENFMQKSVSFLLKLCWNIEGCVWLIH